MFKVKVKDSQKSSCKIDTKNTQKYLLFFGFYAIIFNDIVHNLI